MLKELFKFHSKEEDFRVKCLILILLGIALIINPANGYTLINEYTLANSTNTAYNSNSVLTFDSNANRTLITKVDWDGWCYIGSGSVWAAPRNIVGKLGTAAEYGYVNISYTALDYTQVRWQQCSLTFDFSGTTGDYTTPAVYYYENTTLAFNNFQTHQYSVSAPSPPRMTFGLTSGSGYSHYEVYSGSDLPDAPVINDFTNDLSCYYPGQAIALESDVSGELEDQLTWTWTWEIYDGDTFISDSSDAVETIMTAPGVGVYDVQLTVTNEGGTDFMQKLNMINVSLGGNCTPINNWTPFPGVTTPVPTAAVFPSMTPPPVPFVNQTGINEAINESIWGNWSLAYRTYIDGVGDSVNQTVVGSVQLVTSPFAFIVNGIAVTVNLFTESIAGLMSYTTIPLSITARLVNVMPWEIQSLITAGLAIDAIFLMFYGKG